MNPSSEIKNKITADQARKMVPDIKLEAIERELVKIYDEIRGRVRDDKTSLSMVSPQKFPADGGLALEVIEVLKKDGYNVTISNRSHFAIYDITWT